MGRVLSLCGGIATLVVFGCGTESLDAQHASGGARNTGGTSGTVAARPAGGAASSDGGGTSQSGDCHPVLASDYDQSCTVDADCVPVGQISSCPARACD